MAQRWKNRPPGSNWGEFGPDDQRGRMNTVTKEKVLQGVAEVKEGISFCLSLPLDYRHRDQELRLQGGLEQQRCQSADGGQ